MSYYLEKLDEIRRIESCDHEFENKKCLSCGVGIEYARVRGKSGMIRLERKVKQNDRR